MSSIVSAHPAVSPLVFTSAEAMTTLLTVESLMFAAFSVAIALSSARGAPRRLLPQARSLGGQVAGVLTVLGVGAGVAWLDIFARHGSLTLARGVPAVCIALGIIAQPVFAWRLVATLRSG
jgi:hypothetical protein